MRIQQSIRAKLETAFAPMGLEIEDQSARHAGHAGAHPEGESHFHVLLVSAAFDGKSRPERHRMIHKVLADELSDRVHALSLTLLAPGEDRSAARNRE